MVRLSTLRSLASQDQVGLHFWLFDKAVSKLMFVSRAECLNMLALVLYIHRYPLHLLYVLTRRLGHDLGHTPYARSASVIATP
jgi:hypothetical protein